MHRDTHSVPPVKVRGSVGILDFLVFWGGQNIFDFRGGGGYIYLGKVSSFSVHFPKNSKNFACGTLIFNIHIVRFKIHARLQSR